MRIAMSLLAVSLAVGSACKKKESPDTSANMGSGTTTTTTTPPTTGSGSDMAGSGSAMAGSGDMAGSGSAMAGSGDMAGSGAGSDSQAMSKRGGNCPSLVAGSTTKAELKDGKILVTVTSDDKDAIAAIQKRSEEVTKEKTDGGAPGTAHDQKGTHGGGMGICPVHLGDGGTATVKNDKKGVVITITPKDKAEILKGEIDARITKAAEWVKTNVKEGDKGTSGGVGGGKGEHGSNHSGSGDSKGQERKGGDGKGGGKGTGGGGGAGTGSGSGSAK
ncbi:MAG: hypothetical protein JWP01_3907 [Myxococcales bacterium]|nr:hypothetical protein [Myxococcales bacterium]